MVVTKAGRLYGQPFGKDRGMTQGDLDSNIQHYGGNIDKGGATVSLLTTGGSSWVGMGGRRAYHSFLCG